MSSTDAGKEKRKAVRHHKKVGWPSPSLECPERAPYCCPAAEVMLSRPRSATPTMHDQIMRDRHRVRVAEEASRPGKVGGGRGSPYHPPETSALKRSYDGKSQRSQSSDHHHRPPLQVAVFLFFYVVFSFC